MDVTTKIHLYPFTAAVIASPIPVLPLVASIIVPPGFNIHFLSASSIIEKPMRSFTLQPGLADSNFANICGFNPLFILLSFISGVLPICSIMLFLYSTCVELLYLYKKLPNNNDLSRMKKDVCDKLILIEQRISFT